MHCITITKDGLVLVCDRSHNRMQMSRKDGTFVREVSVLKNLSIRRCRPPRVSLALNPGYSRCGCRTSKLRVISAKAAIPSAVSAYGE